MSNSKDPYELKERKRTLQQHLLEFKRLQNMGKWQEAMEQFNITMRYATESLAYSIQVLQDIHSRLQRLDPQRREKVQREARAAVARFSSLHRSPIIPEEETPQ